MTDNKERDEKDYGRGFGRGRGNRRGFGCPGYAGHCHRFPWLPRWWWAKDDAVEMRPDKAEEKEMLRGHLAALDEEMSAVKKRLEEIE